jgi:glycosyltransferase involved in cell wall biosynthesis
MSLLDFEHVIHEGGTTSEEALALIGSCPHIRYSSYPDSGIYDGMNTCLSNAQGTYCFTLNSDDVLLEKALPYLKLLLDSREDVFCFDTLISDPGDNTSSFLFSSILSARLALLLLPLGMPYPHPGFVSRTSLAKRIKFQTNVGSRADLLFIYNVLSLYGGRPPFLAGIPLQRFELGGASYRDLGLVRGNPHLQGLRIVLISNLALLDKLLCIPGKLLLAFSYALPRLFSAFRSRKT